jgi:2-amino-4-hydroxy-6-hydroxymethyldihydropteridine diphosphokinase
MIGGNIGNRLANLENARNSIDKKCGSIQKRSSIYETEAWGLKDQPSFYNQALCIQTISKAMLHSPSGVFDYFYQKLQKKIKTKFYKI